MGQVDFYRTNSEFCRQQTYSSITKFSSFQCYSQNSMHSSAIPPIYWCYKAQRFPIQGHELRGFKGVYESLHGRTGSFSRFSGTFEEHFCRVIGFQDGLYALKRVSGTFDTLLASGSIMEELRDLRWLHNSYKVLFAAIIRLFTVRETSLSHVKSIPR